MYMKNTSSYSYTCMHALNLLLHVKKHACVHVPLTCKSRLCPCKQGHEDKNAVFICM